MGKSAEKGLVPRDFVGNEIKPGDIVVAGMGGQTWGLRLCVVVDATAETKLDGFKRYTISSRIKVAVNNTKKILYRDEHKRFAVIRPESIEKSKENEWALQMSRELLESE